MKTLETWLRMKPRRDCRFRSRVTLARLRVARAKELKMALAFKGNGAVGPARRSYTVPIKGR